MVLIAEWVLAYVDCKQIKNLVIMKKRRFFSVVVAGLLFPLMGFSQATSTQPELAIESRTYKTGIGLRAGETSGFTVKQFIGQRSALEGIFGVWHHGLSATLLYEFHTQAFNVSGLNWYYGLGGHAAFDTGNTVYYYRGDRHAYYRGGSVGLGIDGMFGMEYKVPNAPFAVNAGIKPYAEVITTGGYWMSLDPGIGIRVVF